MLTNEIESQRLYGYWDLGNYKPIGELGPTRLVTVSPDSINDEPIYFFDDKALTMTFESENSELPSFLMPKLPESPQFYLFTEIDKEKWLQDFKEGLKELTDTETVELKQMDYLDVVGPSDGENIYCNWPGCKKHLKKYASETEATRKGFCDVGGHLYCKRHGQEMHITLGDSICKVAESFILWGKAFSEGVDEALRKLDHKFVELNKYFDI